MRKIKYEVDPHNRLSVDESTGKSNLTRFRKVIDGQFRIGKNNILTYHVKSPSGNSGPVPNQFKLKGKWSLDKNHDLRLTLNKWGRDTFGDRLTLKGELVGAEKDLLLFSVITKTKHNETSTYILKLKGAWKADKHNRLVFEVKKEGSKHDSLLFTGAWELDKSNQIIYKYKKFKEDDKQDKLKTIIFKGYWFINDKTRISYVFTRDDRPVFQFSGALSIFTGRYIKYQIGIGIKGEQGIKGAVRTLIFNGLWRIKKDKGLTFEIKHKNGKVVTMVFGAEAKLFGKNKVLFRLRNEVNKDIRISLRLSRHLLRGDGEIFLRLLNSRNEVSMCAGAGWKW